jgi:hypothetical protein
MSHCKVQYVKLPGRQDTREASNSKDAIHCRNATNSRKPTTAPMKATAKKLTTPRIRDISLPTP